MFINTVTNVNKKILPEGLFISAQESGLQVEDRIQWHVVGQHANSIYDKCITEIKKIDSDNQFLVHIISGYNRGNMLTFTTSTSGWAFKIMEWDE